MFRRKTERLPWYRARGYNGDLRENEKRELDAFRMKEKHPAASYDRLPGEVQNYINKLQMELYDTKQTSLARVVLVVSGIGAFFLGRCIIGYAESSLFDYIWAVCLLILPGMYYRIKWTKNADEYLAPGERLSFAINEALRTEWEQEYIVHVRSPSSKRSQA
jgi:hypothetical protein